MTVWVENALWPRGKFVCGHLFSDSLDELHAIAEALEINGKYYLGHAVVPHYSIPEHMIESAVAAGAERIGSGQRHVILERAYKACSRASPTNRDGLRSFDPIPRRRRGQGSLFSD